MKKTVYVPRGESYRFENLTCESIVVSGSLRVDGAIRATHISGNGFIWANDISASTITASTIDAGVIVADRLIAERVAAVEIRVAQNAAISCYVEADLFKATKVTLTDASISDLVADEVIYLKPKARSLLGTLLASLFKTFMEDYFYMPTIERPHEQADAVDEPTPQQTTADETLTEIKALLEDMEFRRMKAMYDLTRNGNYIWQLTPVTEPTERAVQFIPQPAVEQPPAKEVAA